MKIRLGRILLWTVAALVVLVGAASLVLWYKLRGTTVHLATIDAADVSVTAGTPQVIRLWPGKAPGSESWTQQETETRLGKMTFVRNVVDPTITAYFPAAATANGTAMIICPGGGFHMLTMTSEGTDVARDLNAQGITAFILRYRLTKTNSAFLAEMMNRIRTPGGLQPILEQMTPLINADGQQALRIVRSHAAQWGIKPDRIGVIGFSAGGYLALHLAMHHDADAAPDFIAPIYPLAPIPLAAPSAKIPLFVVAADDDPLVPPTPNAVLAYNVWHSAGLPAELHTYPEGGHGFGMRKQGKPIDGWTDLFHDWLQTEGYLPVQAAK